MGFFLYEQIIRMTILWIISRFKIALNFGSDADVFEVLESFPTDLSSIWRVVSANIDSFPIKHAYSVLPSSAMSILTHFDSRVVPDSPKVCTHDQLQF